MSGTMILTIVAVSNAVLVGVLVYLVFIDRRQGEIPENALIVGQLPATPAARVQAASAETAGVIPLSSVSREADYSAKVKMALAKLESGAPSKAVAEEFGFSSSEMSVLAASAQRAQRVMLHDETSRTIQD